MSSSDSNYKEIQFLRQLHPDLPEKEMRDAEDLYRRYLALRLRIFDRVEHEELETPAGRLTENQFYGIDSDDAV